MLRFTLGAQNVSDQDKGAFTGEVSTNMLVDVKAKYVIVGHSERRSIYGESSSLSCTLKLTQYLKQV